MTVLAASYVQTKGYSAKSDRHVLEGIIDGEGVLGPGDLVPATSGTLTMTVQAGQAAVRGDTNADQGIYICENDAQVTKTHGAHHATLPRLDQVVMRVYDKTEAGGVTDLADIEIVAGTATSGATLDNRNGAASLPASAMLIADVLVPATSGSITLRDRRPFAASGAMPPIKTTMQMVGFTPCELLSANVSFSIAIAHASHDLDQSAALMYLPRRIVGATRIRWKYAQDATTALAGNYNIGIYDASGRLIISTGSVAFTGATSTFQVRSETISATTFEAGLYWVAIGIDTSTGTARMSGVNGAVETAASPGPPVANVFLANNASGGTTLPTTITGMTDLGGVTANTTIVPVPLVALSVG